jgi:hypothetical protein
MRPPATARSEARKDSREAVVIDAGEAYRQLNCAVFPKPIAAAFML